jgi:hypothetical protein
VFLTPETNLDQSGLGILVQNTRITPMHITSSRPIGIEIQDAAAASLVKRIDDSAVSNGQEDEVLSRQSSQSDVLHNDSVCADSETTALSVASSPMQSTPLCSTPLQRPPGLNACAPPSPEQHQPVHYGRSYARSMALLRKYLASESAVCQLMLFSH